MGKRLVTGFARAAWSAGATSAYGEGGSRERAAVVVDWKQLLQMRI